MAKKDGISKEKQTVEKKLVTPLDGPYLQYQNKRLLDFSSEDFLGLSQHPDVKKSAIKYTLRLGVGTLSHTFESLLQKQIEEKLANLLGFEKAFFFHSFSELLSFLLKPDSVVFSDQPLNISQVTHTFSSLEQLKTLLSKAKLLPNTPHIMLISSPSFDLKTLHTLAKEACLTLCFNDKEHFGVAGKRGLGFGAEQKVIDCVIGSFQPASGCPVAYIATSDPTFKERPAIQPLIPSSLGALDSILNLVPDMDGERAQMEKHIAWLKAQLQEKGFSVPLNKSPKITLPFSSEAAAERFLHFFIENDIMLGHLEPKILSFNLTALHTPDDLDQLSTVLKKLSDTDFALSTQSSTPTP